MEARPAPVRHAGSWTAKAEIRLVREGGEPGPPVTPRVSGAAKGVPWYLPWPYLLVQSWAGWRCG